MKNILYITLSSILLFSCGDKQDETKAEEKTVVKKATISTIKIKPQLFAHYFEVQGAIEAEKNVLVVPEVGGLIKTLPVKVGQNIKRGQTIATFDSDVVASNIEELKEQLDVAKYMYEKQQSLFDQGVGTEMALKQAEGQYKTLKQTLVSVQTQKGKFVLRSPFSGYVEEVFPVVGQVAGPGSPIIRLIDLSKMSVKADISESYLAKIDEKKIATLIFPALDNERLENLPIKRIGKFQ
jgi:RND family efflux transporter MFP subunit